MSYTHDVKWATNGKYWNLPDINLKGLVLHSVGCPQPRADVFAKNFNSPNARASIHGCIEPGRFIEMAPIYKKKGRVKKCYHVGSGPKGSRNSTHIGIEMTEPSTIKYTGGASFKDLNRRRPGSSLRTLPRLRRKFSPTYVSSTISLSTPIPSPPTASPVSTGWAATMATQSISGKLSAIPLPIFAVTYRRTLTPRKEMYSLS